MHGHAHRRTRRGAGGRQLPGLKIFRANYVFRASASCSKIVNDENISIQWKFSGQTLFQGKCKVAQNFWHYRRRHYKRIQMYRTDLQEVSGPIRIKLKMLVSGQIVYFQGKLLFSGQNFPPPVKCLPVRLWSCAPPRFGLLLDFRRFVQKTEMWKR